MSPRVDEIGFRRRRSWPGFVILALAVIFGGAGCTKSDDAVRGETAGHGDDDHGHHSGEESGLAFQEGRGLRLDSQIEKALELRTVQITERPLAAVTTVTAQVFAVKPEILASAAIPENEADRLEGRSFAGATLIRLERTAAQATGRVDAIFQLAPGAAGQVGDFVRVAALTDATTALVAPVSSLLETAQGAFVYVKHGAFYRRAPVQTGRRSPEYVEISAGLRTGDTVVVTSVTPLWLAELRLTKGGGHSH